MKVNILAEFDADEPFLKDLGVDVIDAALSDLKGKAHAKKSGELGSWKIVSVSEVK